MNNLNLTELEIRDLLNRYRSEMRKLEFQIQKTQSTLEELSQVVGETPPTAPIRRAQTSSEPKKRGPGRPPKKKGPGRPTKKKRGPGRPPKSESEKRGPGRPPKKKRGPGRPPKKKRGPGRPPKKKRGPGRPPKSESEKRGPGRPPKKKRGPGRPPKKKGPGRPPKSGKRKRKKSGSYKLSDWDQFIIDTIDKADKPLINSELFDNAKKWDEAKNLSDDDIKQYISRTIHKLANKHNTLKKTPYEGRGYAYATEKMVFNNGKLKKEYNR